MRVDIQHRDENVGMVFKKMVPAIVLTIQFSPEEIKTISEKGLAELVFHEPPLWSELAPHLQIGLVIKHFMPGHPRRTLYDTKAKAQADDPRLRESLKQLKEIIDQHSQEPQSGSYEL